VRVNRNGRCSLDLNNGGGNGTGNGTLQFTVAANSAAARSGTITVGGQVFTLNQASGCSIVIAPATQSVPANGGSGSLGVTTNSTCTWTATADVPWITAGGSGMGNGTVQFTVAANTGAARTGTIAVGGQTFTVAQESGCTFTIAPSAQNVPVAGGPATVMVTSAGGCAWIGVSNVAWITITAGTSGSGSGSVQFTIDANATGAPRSGTLTIAGQTFTVTQDGS
jgi:hypothetical protein